MDFETIEQDLKFIRKTMETSTKYTNIPALGYFVAGLIALAGTGLTFTLLSPDRIAGMKNWLTKDGLVFISIWTGTFVAAFLSTVYLLRAHARNHSITAWNPLAARMYLSQAPIALLSIATTGSAVVHGSYVLLPGFWLLSYGVILWAFSYFTGLEHKIGGTFFLSLGLAALVVNPNTAVVLLAVGFGLIHLILGIVQWIKTRSLL